MVCPLFASGERWLEVQAAGTTAPACGELCVKAADSATLGVCRLRPSCWPSKAAADFATAGSSSATTTASTVTTTGGTAGYVPEFTGAILIADSPAFINEPI